MTIDQLRSEQDQLISERDSLLIDLYHYIGSQRQQGKAVTPDDRITGYLLREISGHTLLIRTCDEAVDRKKASLSYACDQQLRLC
jgi:hypothetical protein